MCELSRLKTDRKEDFKFVQFYQNYRTGYTGPGADVLNIKKSLNRNLAKLKFRLTAFLFEREFLR